MIGTEVLDPIGAALGDRVVRAARAPGAGSINDAWRVELASGTTAFVKTRSGSTGVEFEAEAAGLRWLAEAGAVRVPAVLAVGTEPGWLALEWVEPGAAGAGAAEDLGRRLALLHDAGANAHGALPPGSPDQVLRIGPLELACGPTDSWPRFYAERLLAPLANRARDNGSLSPSDAAAVAGVCARIEELAGPGEAPGRLHGDLWSGNVYSDAAGRPWLIDPAAYGGHREVDLAMLRLFGSPGDRLFAAYEEVHPLADGHAERVELWQLFPLLVHAVLFGGSYGASAGRAARRYS
ncbi:MAG TPA: fructosamine kinase family protein [Solirubrobacterales bacterium]|nr:fructosamine kinase family protein [Solirubrobacterales bacterium]